MLPGELRWLWIEQVCWGNNDVKRSEHINEMEGRYIKIHIIIIIIIVLLFLLRTLSSNSMLQS